MALDRCRTPGRLPSARARPGRWPRRAAGRCGRCRAAGPGRCITDSPRGRRRARPRAQVAGQLLAQRAPGPARTATGRSSRATRASPGHRDSPPSANPRSAAATSAAPACSRPTLRSRGHRASLAGLAGAPGERPAGQRHKPGTGLPRHWPPPPGTPSTGHAPARGDRPQRTLPAARPREISSRSASDSRSGERSGSRLAGRCNAITARRIAYRDRLISRCNRHTGAPSASSSAIRRRLLVRDPIHSATSAQDPTGSRTECCVDPLRPSPVMRPADYWRQPSAERPD